MQTNHSETDKDTIVLTGFGPFAYHSVNDSWEAVKMVYSSGLDKELNVRMVIHEIPVAYKDSVDIVKQLWEENNPTLVVHVGVHNSPDFKIEKLARRSGYCRVDVKGESSLDVDGPDVITTGINLEELVNKVDSCGYSLRISDDAGKYLCEYTYYLSLMRDNNRTLFVHIAPQICEISCSDKATILKNIVKCVYNQLKDKALENEIPEDDKTRKNISNVNIAAKGNEIPVENETTKL